MSIVRTCVAMAATLAASAHAGESSVVLHVRAGDRQSLQDALLTLAQQRLQPSGLHTDRERAWMTLSGPVPAVDALEVRSTWNDPTELPALPLTFALRPKSSADMQRGAPPNRWIQATLAVPLLRDVWVAARRLRKGLAVSCADLKLQRRNAQDVARRALPRSCEITAEAVALRDIAMDDVVRSGDVGPALDVTAGAPVRVSVATNGISVTTTAMALVDARVGDQVDVRLRRPLRILRTRVTGPGAVQLMDGSL